MLWPTEKTSSVSPSAETDGKVRHTAHQPTGRARVSLVRNSQLVVVEVAELVELVVALQV